LVKFKVYREKRRGVNEVREVSGLTASKLPLELALCTPTILEDVIISSHSSSVAITPVTPITSSVAITSKK